MRILLAVPEYPPYNIGGGGEVYMQLANKYKELGHDVIVVYGDFTNQKMNTKVEYSETNGLKFYKVPEIPFPKSKPFLRTVMPPTFKAWWQLRSIIKSENIEVGHIHGYGWPFSNIIADICNNLHIPYIYTLHGYPESQNDSNLFVQFIWNIFISFIQNKTLKNAKNVTAISNYIAKDKRNIVQEKTSTIYNGINKRDFVTIEKEVDVRKQYDMSDNTLFIYSIGRIAKMKGFQEVIKLLPEIKKEGRIIKYLIAGDDDGYKKELELLIKNLNLEDNVIFTGFHDDNTKKMYIKQCDIYAVPSLWEPFGLVVLEGMVFNKKILTYESGGIKELLKDYPNKILIQNSTVVKEILKKNNKEDSIDETQWERFDWKNIANQYINLLKETLKLN